MLSEKLPENFYLNDWTRLEPEAEKQFLASDAEIKNAAETRDQRILRRELRKQKDVLFRAILEVGDERSLDCPHDTGTC